MSYEEKTLLSKELFERAKRVIPGGVCHNLRYFPPYPFFVEKAWGSRIMDVDGNTYIDYWMGHYTHILGHRHPDVVKAVTDYIKESGYHFGLVNKEEIKLAELVVELVPCAECVRFCCSATEAAMYAVRLARAWTGKDTIMKAVGGWHGASTDLSFGISYPFNERETLGIPDELEARVKLFTFNDWDDTLRAMDECGDDLAAVIIEPVLGVGGFIPATKDYLKSLKNELEKRGALLIFDETITGFRVSPGGYQEFIGVTPHLTVLGKILGGGFPIGAVCGPMDILMMGSYERRKPNRVLVGGGTFSCNPISMVAGRVVLERLLEDKKKIYPYINSLCDSLRKGIEEAGKAYGLKVETTGIGSLFMIHVKKEDVPLRSCEDIYEHTYWDIRDTSLRRFLASHGVHMIHGGGAVSYAHTEEEVEATVNVVGMFFEEFKG